VNPTNPEAPAPRSRDGLIAVLGVSAVLALVLSFVAVILAGGEDSTADASGASGTAPTHVALTEFAIDPASLSVPEGGSLHVVNDGTTAHNLTVEGEDLATPDLAAGEAAELDLSSLAAGSYTVVCLIPGHADAGMTASLEIGGAAPTDEAAATGDHAGHGGEVDYEALDRAMAETISQFPAETEGIGNQELEPTVTADGTKHFELTAAITPWEVAPGQVVDAWTYNGTVPGPQMHVEVGDHVEIELHNDLPMGTDLHLHGVNVPNSMDGVAPITQDLIEPGGSFTYEFTADEPAVAMYHAHHHAQMTVPNGLLGMFYVGDVALPRGRTISGQPVPADLQVSQEIPMVLNDAGVIGYSLNGKSFPATAPIVGRRGDWILVHYANEGTQIHPMHLHQFDQIVVAKDGFPLDEPYVADTLNVAPGERYSVLIQLEQRGTWVWHCHILPHVERDTGMYGMVTAIVVE
jgi:FtsP/CotA-like multicopper oxidase with cupredoxin domain